MLKYLVTIFLFLFLGDHFKGGGSNGRDRGRAENMHHVRMLPINVTLIVKGTLDALKTLSH